MSVYRVAEATVAYQTVAYQSGSAVSPDAASVLSKAVFNAAKALGVSQATLGLVVGKDRTSIARGLEPASKSGELALMFIRVYRALHVLMGAQSVDMRHWMKTQNLHTGGVPAEQVKTVQGLNKVLEYLDAIRGKL